MRRYEDMNIKATRGPASTEDFFPVSTSLLLTNGI